ncbi:antibiotic biosynthesis monooxygenase [Streptomyces sp. NPDC048663]|uniref:antibiotic biosynthesis monooxygenase family protein n=1 Tax=Streptomyces sp. NPDC048663 TaxID=3155638 RepID=UPI00344A8746
MKVTALGIFTVAAEKQQDLVEAINRAGEVVRKFPGFLGSTLYASVDGTRVVNQSHWTSVERHDAVLEDPEAMALVEVMFAIAKLDPIICVERGEFNPA